MSRNPRHILTSLLKTYKTFRLYCGFISYKQNDDITDINRIQEYEVKAGVTLDAAASGGRRGRVGYCGKKGGGRGGGVQAWR